MPNSRVKIAIAGAEYGDWFAVDIDSDIFTPADAFSVRAAFPDDPEFLEVFREGVRVDVYIDDDRQMAGVIDRVSGQSSPDESSVSIEGRDLGAYLADTEAKAIKAKNYTIKTLMEALIQPEWGIKSIILSNDDNRKLALGKKDKRKPKSTQGIFQLLPRSATKIDPGTKIAQVLDLRTRQLGLTWWMTVDGSLFIGKPNYSQDTAYEFRCYRPGTALAKTKNNCAVSFERSLEGRFSKITMAGQSMKQASGNVFDTSGAAAGTKKFKATATDPDLVARAIRRELIVVDNDALSNDEVQKHADFDMQQRRLNALRIHIDYPSLRYDETESLFVTDTLAHVIYEEANIDGTFYLSQRRNLVSSESERTQMTLIQPGVWLP